MENHTAKDLLLFPNVVEAFFFFFFALKVVAAIENRATSKNYNLCVLKLCFFFPIVVCGYSK